MIDVNLKVANYVLYNTFFVDYMKNYNMLCIIKFTLTGRTQSLALIELTSTYPPPEKRPDAIIRSEIYHRGNGLRMFLYLAV